MPCNINSSHTALVPEHRDGGTPQHTAAHTQSDNTNTREHLTDPPDLDAGSEDVDTRRVSESGHKEAPSTEQPGDMEPTGMGRGSLETEQEKVEGKTQKEERTGSVGEEGKRKETPDSWQQLEEKMHDSQEELVDTTERDQDTPSQTSDGDLGDDRGEGGERQHQRRDEYTGRENQEDDEKSEWEENETVGGKAGGERGGERGEKEGEEVAKAGNQEEDPVLEVRESGVPGGEASEEEEAGKGEESEEESKEEEPEEGSYRGNMICCVGCE